MTKPTNRKKRNKLTILLLAPVMALTFIVGWSLCSIGQIGLQNTKQPQKQTAINHAKQDTVELFMIPQEKQILAN